MCYRPQVLRFLYNSEGVGISSSIFDFSVDDRFTQTVVLTGGTFGRLAEGERSVRKRFGMDDIYPMRSSPSLINGFN